jgi:hypothetical protein
MAIGMQVRGKEPEGEIQMYTWFDANLRELSDLIKEVRFLNGGSDCLCLICH